MKRFIFSVILLLATFQLFAQIGGIQYQAVILDNDNPTPNGQLNYLADKELIVRFTIKDKNDKIEYQEEHKTKTDAFGLLSATIGRGTITAESPMHSREIFFDDGTKLVDEGRDFIEISWDGTQKVLTVEVSLDRTLQNFKEIDKQELSFVPYAFHKDITAFGTMDIEGTTNLNNNLTVRRKSPVNLSGTLTVEKETQLEGQLNVNADTQFNDYVVINNEREGDEEEAYSLVVEGKDQGMLIKIDEQTSGDYNYITFDGYSRIRSETSANFGSISGKTVADAASDPEYIFTNVLYVGNLTTQIIASVLALIETPLSAGTTFIEIMKLIALGVEILGYNAFALTDIGVSYNSAWGDYAEWLERADVNEQITFGEIVGVHDGKISKNIEGAEQILVISKAPIVLGNIPKSEEEVELGEKVAFMGQVPVWVEGVVKQGDYIVAKGDGIAMAVSYDNLTIEMMPKIIGKAWHSNILPEKKLVLTVVGLETNEWQKLMQKNTQLINALEQEMQDLDNKIKSSNQRLFDVYLKHKAENGVKE